MIRRFRIKHTLEIRFWLIAFAVIIAILITKTIQDKSPVEIDYWCESETGFSYEMCIVDEAYAEREFLDIKE